jgi:DNA primase
MAQDQVEEVKSKTDIVSLIGEYVDLKKAGRNYKALCPFHSEKTPSFMVSPELQIFKCFGCGESGDALSFLQKYEAMDFGEALKFLAKRAGVELTPLKSWQRSDKEQLYKINNLASRFYSYLLLKHSVGRPALEYLRKERGLKLDTIKEFQLGFSPQTLDALKSFLVDKKKIQPGDVEKAGIVYLRGGRMIDRFRGRVVFPLFDHRGNVAGFAGRILPSKGSPDMAKYINSPETSIYHKAKLLYGLNLTKANVKRKKEVVVVEGELDMISSWQAGVKNVVAIKGSALTEDQTRLIGRFAKKLTLAPDTDIAGDTAARRGIAMAQNQGLEVKVAKIGGHHKDPDEMARKDPKGYKKALKNAVGGWDFIIDSIFSKSDPKTGEGKAKISQETTPVLAVIGDKIVQAHYTELVAERLGVPVEAVSEQVSRTQIRGVAERPELVVPQPKEKSRRELLEERLLTLAFQFDPKILMKDEIVSLVSTPLTKRILEEYKQSQKPGGSKKSSRKAKDKDFDPSEFASRLPKELVEGFAEMILSDTEELTEKPDKLKNELDLVIRELQLLEIRGKLAGLAEKIGKFEKSRQKKKLEKAKKKFSELSHKLSDLEEEETRGIIF